MAVVVLLATPASAMMTYTDGVVGKELPGTNVTNGVVTSAEYPYCLVDAVAGEIQHDELDELEACTGLFVSVGLPDPNVDPTALFDSDLAKASTTTFLCSEQHMIAPGRVSCERDFGGERKVKQLLLVYCQPSCGSTATSGSIHNYPTSNRENPVYWYYDYNSGGPMRVACSEGKGRDWRLTGLDGVITRDESPRSHDGQPCYSGGPHGLWNVGARWG